MPFFGGLLRFSFDKGATEFAAKLCSSPTNSSLGTSFEYSLIVLLPWDFLNSMFSIVFLRQLKFCQGVSCLGNFFCSKYGHCACAVQHWSTWIRIHHSCATCLAANAWSIWSQGGNILPNLACNKGWSTVAKEKTGFVWFCCRRGRKGKFLCTFHCPLQVSVFPFEASGVSSSSSSSSKEHWIFERALNLWTWVVYRHGSNTLAPYQCCPSKNKTTKQHHSEKQAIRTAAQGSRGSTVPPSPCWKQEKQCQGWHSFAPSVSPPQCRRCEPHQQMRQEQRETHKCQPEISRVAMTQVD